MPIDAQIPLQVRPYESPNMLANYAQVMGIQNAAQQNRLGNLQYDNALRQQQDEIATQEAFRNANGDYGAARNALLAKGLYGPAIKLDEAAQKKRLADAGITEKDLAAAKVRAELFSGEMIPLADKARRGLPVTHDDVMEVGGRLAAQGVLQKGWEASVPMNAMELPNWVLSQTLKSEQARKGLEARLPQMEKVDAGGQIGFVNKNPLAGPVGVNIDGSPVIAKTATPGEVESARHNKVTEGIAGANLGISRDRLNFERSQPKLHYDTERGLLVDERTGATRPVTADGAPLGPKDKPLTESQGKATGMAMRAIEADRLLTALENRGVNNTGITRSIVSGAVGSLPLVGDKLAAGASAGMNTLPSVLGGPNADQQKTDQARRDFINAALRVESGAAISQSEFDNAIKQYFPQPGDSPEVIQQKRASRKTEIEALKAQAGQGVSQLRRKTDPPAADDIIKRADAILGKK